jgi:hypothetical protein
VSSDLDISSEPDTPEPEEPAQQFQSGLKLPENNLTSAGPELTQ